MHGKRKKGSGGYCTEQKAPCVKNCAWVPPPPCTCCESRAMSVEMCFHVKLDLNNDAAYIDPTTTTTTTQHHTCASSTPKIHPQRRRVESQHVFFFSFFLVNVSKGTAAENATRHDRSGGGGERKGWCCDAQTDKEMPWMLSPLPSQSAVSPRLMAASPPLRRYDFRRINTWQRNNSHPPK